MGNTEWNENEFSDESLSSENKGATEKAVRLKTAFIRKNASTKQESRNTSKEGVTPTHVQDIPDEYVLKKKKDLEMQLKPIYWGWIPLFIFGAIAFGCYWYCHTHEYATTVIEDSWLFGEHEVQHLNFLWYLLGFFFLVGCFGLIIIFFVSIFDYNKAGEEYHKVKQMSLSQFRSSSYYKKVETAYMRET